MLQVVFQSIIRPSHDVQCCAALRDVQCCAALVIFGVDSRARLQQRQEGVLVSVKGGKVKRSFPVLVSGVDSRARLQQRQEGVLLAHDGGKVKRSCPVLVSGVDSRARLQQRQEGVAPMPKARTPSANSLHELAGKLVIELLLTIFSQHTQPILTSGKLAPWPDLETIARGLCRFGNALTPPRKPAAAPSIPLPSLHG